MARVVTGGGVHVASGLRHGRGRGHVRPGRRSRGASPGAGPRCRCDSREPRRCHYDWIGPVPCASDDDCWVNAESSTPIARPRKLRGKRFRPCKDGERAPSARAAPAPSGPTAAELRGLARPRATRSGPWMRVGEIRAMVDEVAGAQARWRDGADLRGRAGAAHPAQARSLGLERHPTLQVRTGTATALPRRGPQPAPRQAARGEHPAQPGPPAPARDRAALDLVLAGRAAHEYAQIVVAGVEEVEHAPVRVAVAKAGSVLAPPMRSRRTWSRNAGPASSSRRASTTMWRKPACSATALASPKAS